MDDGAVVPARALDGLRVLDLAILFSAPQISAMLGDLGADGVKLEPPPRGGKPGGLRPGAACGVERHGRHGFRQHGRERGKTGRIAAAIKCIAEDHFLDVA